MINDNDIEMNNPRGEGSSQNAIDQNEIQTSVPTTDEVEAHPGCLSKKTYDLIKQNKFPSNWGDISGDIFRQVTPRKNTVLHIAALYGKDKWVNEVIEKAPLLLAAKNDNGDTALHVAARAGHISILKKLLASLLFKYSEDLEEALNEILVRNNQGNHLFHEALLNDHKDVIFDILCFFEQNMTKNPEERVRIERSVFLWTNQEEKSVLHLATEKGFEDIVDTALTKIGLAIPPGTIIFQSGSIAADMKMEKRRQWLSENKKKQEYCQASAIDKRIKYIPELLPTIVAILKQDPGILRKLMKMGVWTHLPDKKGRTALHYAASAGYLNGVEYLLEYCVSCTMIPDLDGYFPLHLASAGGHVEVVKKLLQYCPDPREILDKDGRNFVHIAALMGKFDVVRYILQDEVVDMINDKDNNGNTPLHLAASRCHPKVVQLLAWNTKVNLNLVNKYNETALDACLQFEQGNPSVRQRLIWFQLKSADAKYDKREPESNVIPPRAQQAESDGKYKKAPNMKPYKDRINTLILVSTLITTVAFAAGFTLPGGTNNSEATPGMALMLNHTWFKPFIICITISMYGGISVTIILIWTQLGDITLALLALEVAMPLLGVTLATLSVAFMAGVHLVINDLSWLATTIMVLCVICILVLLLLYALLWFPLESTNRVIRHIAYYPFQFLILLVERYDPPGKGKRAQVKEEDDDKEEED